MTAAGGDGAEPVGVSEVAVLAPDGEITAAVGPRTVVAGECGSGPTVELDGRPYRTAIPAANRSAWGSGAPMAAAVCGGGGRVRLGPGEHRLRIPATATTRPDTVTLVPAGGIPDPGVDAGTAAATSWGDTERTVEVPALPAPTYLVVHENANAGWRARAGDRELTAVRVDGWQQAWLVPPGVGGEVRLTYWPDRPYRLGLLAGALLAAAVVGLALGRRRPGPQLPDRARGLLPWLLLLAAAVLAAPVLLAAAAAGLVAAALLGRAAAGRPALAVAARPTSVGTAMVAAGFGGAVLVAAVRPIGSLPFGQTAAGQLCCAVALAGLLLPLLPGLPAELRRRSRDSSGRSTSR